MKKGQIQPIFIWIFVLILAVSILFFGFNLIKRGEGFKDEILLVDFFNNLEGKINDYYYLDEGSSGTEEFLLPNGVTDICFVDSDTTDAYYKQFKIDDVMYSNVFVEPRTKFEGNRFKIENFAVDIDPTCGKVSGGRLQIKLENQGLRGVLISEG